MNRRAFTLVELLLAMTLFTSVMVIATVGFIAMNRSFTRGVIRKELSEAAQSLNEEVTRTIRAQGRNATARNCPNDENCPSATGWSAVCIGQVRLLWQKNATGIYKDSSGIPCDGAIPEDKKLIFSDRYKVQAFSVTSIREGLFRVQGLVSTNTPDALTTPLSPLDITCKGSAQSSAVSTCSVERFDFVTSVRQSGGEE